jgi:hypothetical protein
MDPMPHVTTSHNKRRGLSLCMRGFVATVRPRCLCTSNMPGAGARKGWPAHGAWPHGPPYDREKGCAHGAFGGLAPKTLLKWVFMQQIFGFF